MNKNYVNFKKTLKKDNFKLRNKWIKEIYFVYRRKKYFNNSFIENEIEYHKMNEILLTLTNIINNNYTENDIVYLKQNIAKIKSIEKIKK